MIVRPAFLFVAVACAGCAGELADVGREPALSPVGSGVAAPASAPVPPFPSPAPPHASAGSLWTGQMDDLFRDQRAVRPGDLLTVNIAINDRASLGNTSGRSREAKVKNVFDGMFGLFGASESGKAALGVDSQSSSRGRGSVDRSEKIQLSVAALVTGVMANGNLTISGSQEIRVNYELRNLTIAGIVRPRDIARDNTISWDKIAEARVSYGGRGRISEAQQPNVIHQVYDLVKPF